MERKSRQQMRIPLVGLSESVRRNDLVGSSRSLSEHSLHGFPTVVRQRPHPGRVRTFAIRLNYLSRRDVLLALVMLYE